MTYSYNYSRPAAPEAVDDARIDRTALKLPWLQLKPVFFGAAFMLTALSAFAGQAHSLVVGEGFTNPVGFHDASPTFSWKLPAGVKKQTAYRIETRTGEKTWDSGWVESDQSTFVRFKGEPLVSKQRVEWRVSFRDENGADSGWSEPAHFELGLLAQSDWKARWIRPGQERASGGEPVASLRRTFPLTKEVAEARVYVTARGLFKLQLNGQRIGNDHFANGFTSYHKRLDTLTYDITSQLRSGGNTLNALLGTGWYAGRFPFETKKLGPYGRDTALLVQVEIAYEDGSTETIVSDEKWEGAFEGPVVSSSIYDGEEYDARRNQRTGLPSWPTLISAPPR